MSQKIKIKVTQRDINKGVRGKACSCPVAIAIKRALGIKVYVTGNRFYPEVGSFHRLPHEVCEFVLYFDRGEPVKPFEFEIDKP